MKKTLLSLLLIGVNNLAFTQASAPLGNAWNPNKFLGFDISNGVNPLYTKTNNTTRTRLNGNQTTTINGVNQNVSGYFGIGPNGWFNTNSPWAMLHLDGQNVSGNAGNGWRSWMQTGVLMREESDIMYVGLQRFGNNRADAVVSWSDDAGNVDGV